MQIGAMQIGARQNRTVQVGAVQVGIVQIGVALLATIGPALTFVGINPFWEKAIQGAIILAALASDFVLRRVERMRAAQQSA